MIEPWYDLYKDRYIEELDALKALDIAFTVDEKALMRKLLILHLAFQGDNPHLGLNRSGEQIELDVKFPDYYPWFRPEVFAYEISLPRHQGLLEKNLCLLPRGTRFWNPDYTVARLLQENLQVVFEKGGVVDPQIIQADETEQAEPYGEYYPADMESSILFDPTKINLEGVKEFEFLGRVNIGFEREGTYPQRLVIRDTYDPNGALIHSIPGTISALFPETMTGYLYRTSGEPLIVRDPNKFLAWLKNGLKASGEVFRENIQNKRSGDYKYNQVIGLSFTQEIEPGINGPGWIFCVTLTGVQPISGNQKLGRKAQTFLYYAKPSYIHTDAKKDRIPKLSALSDKTVAITGLGTLGSFAALELARAGVKEIRILDFDVVDPPTTVRWPLGITAAGKLKTEAIKEFVSQNYPATKVVVIKYRFGETRNPDIIESEQMYLEEVLNILLQNADILLDATAEEGINSFLNAVILRRNIPSVFMYATTGALGGVVCYTIPGKTNGCWNCVKNWEAEEPEKYFPPFDDNGEIQPPGCGDKTFTGTGFDLQIVSLAAVKMIVGILSSSDQNGYPLSPNNWAVLRHVDENNNAILPRWDEYILAAHPNCSYCAKR